MKDIICKQQNENTKLNVFLGKGRTLGDIFDETGNITGKVDATDTYEWLPGEYPGAPAITSINSYFFTLKSVAFEE